jgi:YVTN family beta-propeller protein/VCBS repeat-containing protein
VPLDGINTGDETGNTSSVNEVAVGSVDDGSDTSVTSIVITDTDTGAQVGNRLQLPGTELIADYTPDQSHAVVVAANYHSAADTTDLNILVVGLAAAANTNPTITLVPDGYTITRSTGAYTGHVTASDPDDDPLTYTWSVPNNGTVTVDPTGTFTYTPSTAARTRAGALNATAGDKQDTFTVIVSDGRGGTDSVNVTVPITPPDNAVVGQINVPNPWGITMSPSGDRLYVTSLSNNTVTVVDTATFTTVGAPIHVGSYPWGIVANSDGSRVYAADAMGGAVSVINTATGVVTNIPVGGNPYEVALNPDSTRLYVATFGTIVVVNTANNSIVRTVGIAGAPAAVTVDPTRPRAYVANPMNNTVSVLDTNTNTVVATVNIPVGSNPRAIGVSPDGSRLYIANNWLANGDNTDPGTVTVLNANDLSVVTTITVGHVPYNIAITPDGARAYVTNSNDGTVSVIDTASNTVIATIPTGGARDIVLSPDGSRAYVSASGGGVGVISIVPGDEHVL